MNTTENNKLIAEFMALDKGEFEILLPNYGWFDSRKDKNFSKSQFDTSWDWLMPVVKKIQGFTFNSREKNYVTTTFKIININETYKAVVEFIKWYNKK